MLLVLRNWVKKHWHSGLDQEVVSLHLSSNCKIVIILKRLKIIGIWLMIKYLAECHRTNDKLYSSMDLSTFTIL